MDLAHNDLSRASLASAAVACVLLAIWVMIGLPIHAKMSLIPGAAVFCGITAIRFGLRGHSAGVRGLSTNPLVGLTGAALGAIATLATVIYAVCAFAGRL